MVNRFLRPALAVLAASGMLAFAEARAQLAPPVQSGTINEHIRKGWTDNKLTPAKQATDNEFIRRVFLDIIGRIPTAEEVKDFEKDRSADRRTKLIHRLLHKDAHQVIGEDGKKVTFEYTREFAEHWADIWTVWTMTRGGTHEVYHNQMRFWFERAFNNNMKHDEMVRKLLIASGKGNEDGASNFVMAHLGEPTPMDKRVSDGPFDAVPITSRVTRLFLGIQTQCTQCHDHPFNPEWGQENFWGVNAFFRQTTRDRAPAPPIGQNKKKAADALPVTVSDSASLNSSMRIYYERRSGVLMSIKPTFLPHLADLEKDKADREKKPIPMGATESRRELLAKFIVEHDTFGKAFVNRMWAHFFGRGLNEQIAADDFGGHNKVVHPELLQKLGDEFVKYKYDQKAVMEWICNSEAYNLSYQAPNKDMAKPEYDVYFARMPLKALSPEVLFEALQTATKADSAPDKDARKAARDAWMAKLVNNFGDDEGNEMTFNGTIVQALLMMNGRELNEEIRRSDGFIAKLYAKKRTDAAMIDEIYLTALSRKPSPSITVETERVDPKTKKRIVTGKSTELAFVQQQLAAAKSGGAKSHQQFFEDLFWSLLNTSEFMLNH